MDASKDLSPNTDNRNNDLDIDSPLPPDTPEPPTAINTESHSVLNSPEEQEGNKNENETEKKNDSNESGDSRRVKGGGSNRKRCDMCGKRLTITEEFSCLCEGSFCALHRYSFRHDCIVDYRALGAEQIRRDNPVISAEKIRKI